MRENQILTIVVAASVVAGGLAFWVVNLQLEDIRRLGDSRQLFVSVEYSSLRSDCPSPIRQSECEFGFALHVDGLQLVSDRLAPIKCGTGGCSAQTPMVARYGPFWLVEGNQTFSVFVGGIEVLSGGFSLQMTAYLVIALSADSAYYWISDEPFLWD